MRQSGSEPVFDSAKWPIIGNNCYDYAFGDLEPYRPMHSEPGARAHMKNGRVYTTCGDISKRILKDNPGKVYTVRPDTVCKPGYYKVMSFVAPENDEGDLRGDFHFYKQVGSVRYKIKKGDTIASIAKFFKVPQKVIRYACLIGERSARNGLVDESAPFHGQVIMFPVNLWAHKLGWGTAPLLVDASHKVIKDPRKANRRYGYHYDTQCGTYCVRASGVRTGTTLPEHRRVIRPPQSRK
jgi:LysM domain